MRERDNDKCTRYNVRIAAITPRDRKCKHIRAARAAPMIILLREPEFRRPEDQTRLPPPPLGPLCAASREKFTHKSAILRPLSVQGRTRCLDTRYRGAAFMPDEIYRCRKDSRPSNPSNFQKFPLLRSPRHHRCFQSPLPNGTSPFPRDRGGRGRQNPVGRCFNFFFFNISRLTNFCFIVFSRSDVAKFESSFDREEENYRVK